LAAYSERLVVVLSSAVGLVGGAVTVRVTPSFERPDGYGAEFTPIHLAAFLAGSAVTFLASLAVGVHWLERRWARGL